MNRNTTVMAKMNPNIPSRCSVFIWPSMAGPSLETVTISTSLGSATPSRASSTALVTSIVLASGSLITPSPTLGLPLVREMLVAVAVPSVTSATSPSRTGAGGPDGRSAAGPCAPRGIPTTRSRKSSRERYEFVALIGNVCPWPVMVPAGRVMLLSLSA